MTLHPSSFEGQIPEIIRHLFFQKIKKKTEIKLLQINSKNMIVY